jgi:phage terminase large subunit-like protein
VTTLHNGKPLAPHPKPDTIPAAAWLTHVRPGWSETMTDAELVGMMQAFGWDRADQHIPTHRWRTCGLTGGRGFGKTRAIARYINAHVRAGLSRHVALAAPNVDRAKEVQIAALILYADPDFVPVESKGGLLWPNGVRAVLFSPEAPDGPRGENISLTWCTEIVAWKPSTRAEFFSNLSKATRIDEERILWDSTARGRNEVRTMLEDWHADDPHTHVLLPGTMLDNPLLSTQYLRGEWRSTHGAKRDEELLGASFRESEGAAWTQKMLDDTRVDAAPELDWICVAVDPATSDDKSADETGIAVGGRGLRDGHAYVLSDLTGKHHASAWPAIVLSHADPRTPGPRRGRVVIERKHLGQAAAEVLRSNAITMGLRLRVLDRGEKWPAFDPGWVYVREQNTNLSKGTRAEGPAAETAAGRMHLVDPGYPDASSFTQLENECTTYVDGARQRSPNRLDALVYLVIELRELRLDSTADHAADARVAADLSSRLAASVQAPARSRVVSGLVSGGGRGRLGL